MHSVCFTRACLDLQDHGISSGIRKVLFGGPLRHFVNKLLFLDSLSWLSKGRIANSLVRYILVDIDDVFVGKNRMLPDDVRALVQSQERLAEMVPGFKYNLGFSGGKVLNMYNNQIRMSLFFLLTYCFSPSC